MAAKTPDYLVHGDGFVDVTLARPLTIDGTALSAIRMREPTVGDQRAASTKGSDAEQEVAMMANLCQLSPADINRLPLRDYKRLQVAFVGFID